MGYPGGIFDPFGFSKGNFKVMTLPQHMRIPVQISLCTCFLRKAFQNEWPEAINMSGSNQLLAMQTTPLPLTLVTPTLT